MQSPEGKNPTEGKSRRLLLVGRPDEVFSQAQDLSDTGLTACENTLKAIELAAREKFDIIFVVLSGLKGKAASVIESLRSVSPTSSIILPAQMHEEPEAMQLCKAKPGGKKLADDYLICPLNINELTGYASTTAKTSQAPEDENKDALIRQLESRIEQLEKLATEDDLTGLKNRRYVREFLRQLISKAKRQELRVTLLVFDIDNFKHYNDTYGHSVGDNVLRQAGEMMVRCCREQDVVGRIGGDEFAVVFWDGAGRPIGSSSEAKVAQILSERRKTDIEHPREAFFMAERFRREISSAEFSFLGSEGKGSLTISGGLASFPHDGLTVEELFERADKAMLDAKQSGKNRIYLVGTP
jgi:two-component system cell cycle response regulator